ncbi:DUF4326 domain-containing protein [Roseibium sp.]|uniref:DUF4326 domain-containing protein n=1 Tax=Roseibium sp. TaxID=1936156 RepID=UPI0032993E72
MSPIRIQMRRDRPWRCDAPDAVIVDRSTKWGNPFRTGDPVLQRMSLTDERPSDYPARAQPDRLARGRASSSDAAGPVSPDGLKMTADDACTCFEFLTIPMLPLQELAGKDLACWCALDAPCHADVLLKFAARLKQNRGRGDGADG